MKTRLYCLLCIAFFSSTALLADNVGPGFGRMLMGGNTDKMSEFMATTSNGTSASKYFAITSGTSGYQKGAVIGYNDAQQYLEENMDMIARDMARGEGEYLDTFAELLEIDNKREFREKMHRNFGKIYTHKDISSGEVLSNVLEVQKS